MAVHAMQARRAERSREREERVKNLGGTLRKESTPGLPLAVVIASGMAIAEQVRAGSGLRIAQLRFEQPARILLPVRCTTVSSALYAAQASRLGSSVAASLPKARLSTCC